MSSDSFSSDYYKELRDPSAVRHVIAFESAPLAMTESPLLRVNDSFKVKFLEVGSYPYRCQIYPRMRGMIQVLENLHQILNIPRVLPVTKQAVFSMGPTVLQQL